MDKDIYLTGITTTGTPHIGNYVGAIRPGIEASKDTTTRHFYFLADYHSLAKNEDPAFTGQAILGECDAVPNNRSDLCCNEIACRDIVLMHWVLLHDLRDQFFVVC